MICVCNLEVKGICYYIGRRERGNNNMRRFLLSINRSFTSKQNGHIIKIYSKFDMRELSDFCKRKASIKMSFKN